MSRNPPITKSRKNMMKSNNNQREQFQNRSGNKFQDASGRITKLDT